MNAPITLDNLREIAVLSGGIARSYFQHFGMARVVKTDTTPVTPADIEINELVISHVRKLSPDIDIVGEEKSDRTSSPWKLYLDPIDGTFPFSWGMPVFTVMLGLAYEGKIIMGVVYDPMMDRMYAAEKGKGAWMNGERLQVSKAWKRDDRPIVGYVSWPNEPKRSPCPYNILKVCQYLEECGVTLVNFCSIGYLEAAVANGELAGTIFPGWKHHDTAAGHIIVEEAGGMATDIFGQPLHYAGDQINGHIMSNGHLHSLIVEAVQVCNGVG